MDLTEGWTPLHWAVLHDNPKAVIWLLKHGADKTIEDFAGRTPEALVDDHLGELSMRRYVGPKKELFAEPGKQIPKKIKQMKEAFKLNINDNEYDFNGYKNTIV